jgi:hypothetical protein
MITSLRDELRQARALAESGDIAGVLRLLDQALAELDDTRLVTIEAAASLLGVRSPIVLQALMRVNGVRTEAHDDTVLVPLSEVARIDDSEWVQQLRASDRLHDIADAFGTDEPMTQEEMDALSASRPGQLPWKRAHDAARDRSA